MPPTQKKVFTDASFNYNTIRILICFLIFFSVFVYFIAIVFKDLALYDAGYIIGFSAAIAIVFAFLVASFIILRKYYIIGATVNSAGISFTGLLRKVFVRWEDILLLDLSDSLWLGNMSGGKVAMLKTRKGVLYFPLTMKEKNKKYPEIKGQLGRLEWRDEYGNRRPIDRDNCPLYVEIQRRIG